MNEIKIEKGIPLPGSRGGTNGRSKYDIIRDMKIGDSFILTVKKSSAYSMSYRLARDYKVKLTIRADNGTFRVWRIA